MAFGALLHTGGSDSKPKSSDARCAEGSEASREAGPTVPLDGVAGVGDAVSSKAGTSSTGERSCANAVEVIWAAVPPPVKLGGSVGDDCRPEPGTGCRSTWLCKISPSDGLLGPCSSKPLGEEEWVPAVNEEDVVEPPSWATAAVSFSFAAWIFISPSAEADGAVTPGMKNSVNVSRRAPLH